MIKCIENSDNLQSLLKNYNDIGFVPTMGNLHEGHLSLIEKSLQNCELTVVSIYVNPTQFSAGEDFKTYPRTLETDIEKIQTLLDANKNLIVFAPLSDIEIYPNGKNIIKATGPCTQLEGELRPGHFDGMVTVVKRLFEIVQPQKAYFGKKDYQQFLIVKDLIRFNNFDIQLIGVDITRDLNGLALSSRNSYLAPSELNQALTLRNTLLQLQKSYDNNNCALDVQNQIKAILAKDSNFNYLAIATSDNLNTPGKFDKNLILLGNYQVGKVKLLDNLEI